MSSTTGHIAPRKTRVLIVEEQMLVRDALAGLVPVDGDLQVAAAVATGKAAIDYARARRPNVVLMNVFLGGLDGIETTRQIHAENGDIALIIFATREDGRLVRGALDAGAIGFLTKRASGAELRQAIRSVAAGRPYFAPEIQGDLVRGPDELSIENPAAAFTRRELEVLRLIAGGSSNPVVATTLGISRKTVAHYRQAILQKLEAHDVTALTRYAVRKGLIEA